MQSKFYFGYELKMFISILRLIEYYITTSFLKKTCMDITLVNAWRFYQNVNTNDDISLLSVRRKKALSLLPKFSSSRRKRFGPQRNKVVKRRLSKAIRLDEGNHFL